MRRVTRNSIVYTGRRMRKDPEVSSVDIFIKFKDGSHIGYSSVGEETEKYLKDIAKKSNDMKNAEKRLPEKKSSRRNSSVRKKR